VAENALHFMKRTGDVRKEAWWLGLSALPFNQVSDFMEGTMLDWIVLAINTWWIGFIVFMAVLTWLLDIRV